MARTVLFIISALLLMSGCKTKQPLTAAQDTVIEASESEKPVNFSDQTTWLLGYFGRERLERPPHSEWFIRGYDNYEFNSAIVNKLTMLGTDELSIKIVLGTWCPDSRREVPRFMRLTDIWKFPGERITFIGTDNAKLSPVGEYESLNIERVPTFIFYRNNIELGRIIETPVTSLEQDMVNILTGMNNN